MCPWYSRNINNSEGLEKSDCEKKMGRNSVRVRRPDIIGTLRSLKI